MERFGKKIFFCGLTFAAALLTALTAGAALGAFDGNPGEAVLEAMERLTSDPASPPVVFSVRENPGDPFSGPSESLLAGAAAWQIQIFDQAGKKVGFIQGRNRPPASGIPWAGVSSAGEPLRDGFYKAKFVWAGPDRKARATGPVSLSLSTQPEIRRLAALRLKLDYTSEGLSVTFAEGMLFLPGESRIKEEALPSLREISRLLKAYPGNKVLVRGHSDSSGPLRLNLALSSERAARVCAFLADSGIPAGRLEYLGAGPSAPLASNDTEEGRARNRRVEVVVLKNVI